MENYCGPACRICGVPLVSAYADRCRKCIEDPPAYSRAASFGIYEKTLAAAIHHFKFLGVRRLAKPLAELMLVHELSDIQAIVPVPLTRLGLKSRGFNQSLLLAYYISRRRKIPLERNALKKTHETLPQIGLSAKERAANVKKAFTCTGRVKNLNILLIDDVMTTGSTVNACAAELITAGAKSVEVLTLARAGLI